jgi:hypothetical protein
VLETPRKRRAVNTVRNVRKAACEARSSAWVFPTTVGRTAQFPLFTVDIQIACIRPRNVNSELDSKRLN